MKSLALKDIYADPHKLDSFLDSGKSVEVVRDGRAGAELVPRKAAAAATGHRHGRPSIPRPVFANAGARCVS